MAFIHYPTIAVAIVQAERRRQGIWSDLTPDQIHDVAAVIRNDLAGKLTRADIVTQLHHIAVTP